jgi:hypothetical protein
MYMQYELQATEMNMLRDTILAAEWEFRDQNVYMIWQVLLSILLYMHKEE